MRGKYPSIVALIKIAVIAKGSFPSLAFTVPPILHQSAHRLSNPLQATKDANVLTSISDELNAAIERCQPEFIKTCKVKVAPSPSGESRLGLVTTSKINKGDVALAIPYDDQIVFTPDLAVKTVFKGVLPDGYDGWTGDNGVLALLVLNELAKCAGAGIPLPKRKPDASNLISSWLKALPSPSEMSTMHPILWDEDDQEKLQLSSTKKIYRILDDIEEDSSWLEENIWSKDRSNLPQTVDLNGESYPCFSSAGFRWAMAIVSSRAVFVDGSLRLIPVLDMLNHDDFGTEEVTGGFMGTFGTTKGAQIKSGKRRKYAQGEEFFASYGPKSASEYLLEHGFLPSQQRSMTTSVSELTFELDQEDRFYDDKLDILEFDTYEEVPLEPSQSFDVVSEVGRDGEPDPAMLQFLRLINLGEMDAFLLESIFRQEVWGFMSLPVSEKNERIVLESVASTCAKALEEMGDKSEDLEGFNPSSLCSIVRETETRALTRTLEFVDREKEALDLKEYYQERRLKDLGLDSDWNPDEQTYGEDEDDLSYGQTRAPGGLDW